MHIGEIEDANQVNYAASQKEALQTAINSKVMLLTGGPGTGKTTVIKGIVELYAEIHGLSLDYDDYVNDDYPVVLAAPTGRASKKMTRVNWIRSNDDSSFNRLESRHKARGYIRK